MAPLDKEGRGSAKLMLLEFLPDACRELIKLEKRICLIDGCSSREEYRYHDLERSLEEVTVEATSLCLQKLDAETSIRRVSDQVACTREEALRLSLKLGTTKAKAATLRDQVSSLPSKLESS
ncbi:hypothetical protein ACLOJK_023624 [Asimina triloba]